jgi:hypothetical protein
MQIILRIPNQIREALGPFWISSFNVRVHATTTAKVWNHVHSIVEKINICSCEGFLPFDSLAEGESVTVPPALWQTHVYPFMTPSFNFINVRRTHRLEFSLKLVSASLNTVYVSLTLALDEHFAYINPEAAYDEHGRCCQKWTYC